MSNYISANKHNLTEVGGSTYVYSTKVDAFEASKTRKAIVDDGTNPNLGMKRDTHGNNIHWFGWKLHILSDSHSELPPSVILFAFPSKKFFAK